MKIMAVDLGLARTGVATCDALEMLASPLCVVSEYNEEKLIARLCEIAKEQGVEQIVVGLPKNMDGTEGERAQECKRQAEVLAEKSGVPIVMWDERCTTVVAHKALNVTNTRGKKRKAVVDAVAATVILEDYLNFRKNNK